MTKNRLLMDRIFFVFVPLLFGCRFFNQDDNACGNLQYRVEIGNWQYDLHIEKQGEDFKEKRLEPDSRADRKYYIKALLAIGNSKTHKSLLYSTSRNAKEYESKYDYLAFQANKDFYIKSEDSIIYPVGYVFEPSNGLNTNERLVYKFIFSDAQYHHLRKSKDLEFWYADHITGLGKICFNAKN